MAKALRTFGAGCFRLRFTGNPVLITEEEAKRIRTQPVIMVDENVGRSETPCCRLTNPADLPEAMGTQISESASAADLPITSIEAIWTSPYWSGDGSFSGALYVTLILSSVPGKNTWALIMAYYEL